MTEAPQDVGLLRRRPPGDLFKNAEPRRPAKQEDAEMDVLIDAKLHKPDRMSNKELFNVWKQEADAALGVCAAETFRWRCTYNKYADHISPVRA